MDHSSTDPTRVTSGPSLQLSVSSSRDGKELLRERTSCALTCTLTGTAPCCSRSCEVVPAAMR